MFRGEYVGVGPKWGPDLPIVLPFVLEVETGTQVVLNGIPVSVASRSPDGMASLAARRGATGEDLRDRRARSNEGVGGDNCDRWYGVGVRWRMAIGARAVGCRRRDGRSGAPAISGLAALGPTLSDRFAPVLAHALLGLLALFAALVVLPILMFRADLRARRKNDKLE